jgi:hypothetical protein
MQIEYLAVQVKPLERFLACAYDSICEYGFFH